MDSTFAPVTILMPRLLSMRTRSLRTSSSTGASTLGSISTTVTCEPIALNMQASSMPITPPPTQMMLLGVSGRSQQVSLLITLRPSMPGNGGIRGIDPVARMILSALNCCESPFFVTVTVREVSIVPRPSNTSILLPFMSVPTPLVMRLTTLSLKATALRISKVGGCGKLIPSSLSDSMLCNMETLSELGINLPQPPTFDMRKAVAFKDKVVKRMTSGVGTLMKGNNIDVFDGLGTIDTSRTVTVTKNGDSQQFSADKIILATGSIPLMPPFPGIDGRNVINSDTCWDLPDTPKSIICVGGGVIGMELACMFNAMGSQVTVVEMLPNVLAPVDEEVRKLLVRILSKRGINIVTGAKVESITDEGDKIGRASCRERV